jgi:S1-C subfamily serine protease
MPTSEPPNGVEADSGSPDPSARSVSAQDHSVQLRRPAFIAIVVGLAITAAIGVRTTLGVDDLRNSVSSLQRQARELKKSETALARRVATAEGEHPDVSQISDAVSPSVFTIEAGSSLGSSWVAKSDSGGSDLVTNFHVVADLWTAGGRNVTVANPTTMMQGTITSVNSANDLALIHVSRQLPALKISTTKAAIGDPVAAFGSPHGLVGTITTGVVSAYRTEQGVEYLQFSAPVSPGSSGGPVVDHSARVLGVTTQKVVDTGVEGLSFAIQSSDVCSTFTLDC